MNQLDTRQQAGEALRKAAEIVRSAFDPINEYVNAIGFERVLPEVEGRLNMAEGVLSATIDHLAKHADVLAPTTQG